MEGYAPQFLQSQLYFEGERDDPTYEWYGAHEHAQPGDISRSLLWENTAEADSRYPAREWMNDVITDDPHSPLELSVFPSTPQNLQITTTPVELTDLWSSSDSPSFPSPWGFPDSTSLSGTDFDGYWHGPWPMPACDSPTDQDAHGTPTAYGKDDDVLVSPMAELTINFGHSPTIPPYYSSNTADISHPQPKCDDKDLAFLASNPASKLDNGPALPPKSNRHKGGSSPSSPSRRRGSLRPQANYAPLLPFAVQKRFSVPGTLFASEFFCDWEGCPFFTYLKDPLSFESFVDRVYLHVLSHAQHMGDVRSEHRCRWTGCQAEPLMEKGGKPQCERNRMRHLTTHMAWYTLCSGCAKLQARPDAQARSECSPKRKACRASDPEIAAWMADAREAFREHLTVAYVWEHVFNDSD